MMRVALSLSVRAGSILLAPAHRLNPRRAFALILIALAVAGCGRSGPPEVPGAAVTTVTPTTTTIQPTPGNTGVTATSTSGTTTASNIPPPKPDRPFILDWLLR
jgi:predicted small lipoprotein YifL